MQVYFREELKGKFQGSDFGDLHKRLRPGFERHLLGVLEDLPGWQGPQGQRVVAKIQIATAQKDEPVWTTGYQQHIELKKGESTLGNSYLVIVVQDGEGGDAHPICEPGYERLFKEYRRSPTELGHFILQGLIWPALEQHRLNTADQIAEYEDRIGDLRDLRSMYISIRGEK